MVPKQNIVKKILSHFPLEMVLWTLFPDVWISRSQSCFGEIHTFDSELLLLDGDISEIRTPTRWGPPVISWFINPMNYSYKYHKP